MDYSLLIGIHDKIKGNSLRIRNQTLQTLEPTAEALSRRATASTRSDKAAAIRKGIQELAALGPSNAYLPEAIPAE